MTEKNNAKFNKNPEIPPAITHIWLSEKPLKKAWDAGLQNLAPKKEPRLRRPETRHLHTFASWYQIWTSRHSANPHELVSELDLSALCRVICKPSQAGIGAGPADALQTLEGHLQTSRASVGVGPTDARCFGKPSRALNKGGPSGDWENGVGHIGD